MTTLHVPSQVSSALASVSAVLSKIAVNSFLEDAKAGKLPAVAFVDPAFGFFNPAAENDEHPGSLFSGR